MPLAHMRGWMEGTVLSVCGSFAISANIKIKFSVTAEFCKGMTKLMMRNKLVSRDSKAHNIKNIKIDRLVWSNVD